MEKKKDENQMELDMGNTIEDKKSKLEKNSFIKLLFLEIIRISYLSLCM